MTPSGPNSPGSKKELTMEQRLMLAFGLMGLVLLVSTYLSPPPAPQPKAKQEPKSAASKAAASPAPAAASAAQAEAPDAQKSAARVAATADESWTIETDRYKVTFANRGGVVRSWILKGFKSTSGTPLDLVNPRAGSKTGYPFSLRFHVNQPATALNSALYAGKLTSGGLGIEMEYRDAQWSARKTFEFDRKSYLAKITTEVRNGAALKPHLLYWRGGFGDVDAVGAAAAQLSVRYDISRGSFETLAASSAEEPQAHRGRFSFAGIADSYFAAVALPDVNKDFEIHSLGDKIAGPNGGKEELNVGVAIGGNAVNEFSFFAGPKDTDLLASVSPRLPQLVDFGWFALIARPLFAAIHWLNDKYVGNYGWTIVIVTVIINFLLLPLKFSSLKSMKKMSALQPEIQKINEKYRGMSFKDPRKQNQQAEVMELYKKHGANPASGCVPMMMQLPFFFAFYKVLSVAIELRGAEWLWVSDLSQPETIAIHVLPLAMIVSQFVMQLMTPSTSADPAQQKIMLFMPLMFGFMFWNLPSGLVLYWLTGNLVGIAQQSIFNRWMPSTVPAGQTTVKVAKPKK